MIRSHWMTSSAAAKAYYRSSDYYAATPGEWLGEGARMLGLEGPALAEQFDALADNLDPRTGQPLLLTCAPSSCSNRRRAISESMPMEASVEPPKSRREYARLYYHKNKDRIRSLYEKRREKRRETQRSYYQRNKDQIKAKTLAYSKKNREKRNARERQSRAQSGPFARLEKDRHIRRYSTSRRYRLRVLTTNAKLRAKQRGMAADPSCFDAILASPPSHCVCCGREFDYKNRRTPHSPSIDRINNDLGYIMGNVAVICFRCNSLKRNGTIADFELILAYMRRSPD